MNHLKPILVSVIWVSIGASLLSGYFYTPNIRASRTGDPKLYWAGLSASVVVGAIATALLLIA